jgi:phage protein D
MMPGSNGSTPTLRAARPIMEVDGQDNPALSGGLLNLLIKEDTQGLYACEITFGNWGTKNKEVGFLYFDRQVLDFGKQLKVKLNEDTLFDGRMMALEAHFPEGPAPRLLTILAEDRLQDLRMTRRTRTFNNVNDASVITQIANDHGLTPDVSLNGPTYPVLVQVNQSDLAFARERARAVEAELWLEGTTLHAHARADRDRVNLDLAYGGQLREFTVLADLAHQRSAVIVSGWDVSGKTALRHEASSSVISGELNGDQSGVSLLASAMGERKETLAHIVPLANDEAQTLAESYFKMAARRFVVGHGVAETNAQLRVGARVNLSGLGPLFNGKYYVTEVQHVFDNTAGLRSEFTVERPGLGRAT